MIGAFFVACLSPIPPALLESATPQQLGHWAIGPLGHWESVPLPQIGFKTSHTTACAIVVRFDLMTVICCK